MIETLNSTKSIAVTTSSSALAQTADEGSASEFSALLENATASLATDTVAKVTPAKADFVSGRIGIDLNDQGVPAVVRYFNESGELLTSSNFNVANILKFTHEFDIPLTDLAGLGEQMDAAGVGYRPYELYPGTGSNHGIDFDNLVAGGLGTAYDWREDPLVGQKGASGQRRLEAARQLAEELGISSTLATPRTTTVATTSDSTSTTDTSAVSGTAAVVAAASVAATTAADTALTQSTDTGADTASAVEDILVTSGSADSSDTGAALADAISDVISDVATALFGDTASAATASSGATESSGSDTASVLSEQQENELLQLANNLSRQQPALAQHLLAVLQASLESKVA